MQDLADAIGGEPSESEFKDTVQQSYLDTSVKDDKSQITKKSLQSKKSGFMKSATQGEMPDMEPEGDLSFNSDKTNFELLIDYFDTVTDLNWGWQRFKED